MGAGPGDAKTARAENQETGTAGGPAHQGPAPGIGRRLRWRVAGQDHISVGQDKAPVRLARQSQAGRDRLGGRRQEHRGQGKQQDKQAGTGAVDLRRPLDGGEADDGHNRPDAKGRDRDGGRGRQS